MASLLWEGLPAALLFGPLFWAMVYLQTYRHFPKMERRKRVVHAATAATVLTLFLLAVVLLALYLVARSFGG